jgi:prevent-host-death family protein
VAGRSEKGDDKNGYNSYIGYMRTISAIDAKNRFGQLLDAAQREPVTVTKKGRPAAVMLSVEDYERIRGTARRRLLGTIEQTQQDAAAVGLTEDVLDQLLTDES